MPESAEQLRERKRLEKQRQRAALRADPEKYRQHLEARNERDRANRAKTKGVKSETKKTQSLSPNPMRSLRFLKIMITSQGVSSN